MGKAPFKVRRQPATGVCMINELGLVHIFISQCGSYVIRDSGEKLMIATSPERDELMGYDSQWTNTLRHRLRKFTRRTIPGEFRYRGRFYYWKLEAARPPSRWERRYEPFRRRFMERFAIDDGAAPLRITEDDINRYFNGGRL